MARQISSLAEFKRLTRRERESRTRALSALSLARREGLSIDRAASTIGSSVEEVRAWAPNALKRGFGGKTYAKPKDSIWRLRPLYVEGELDLVGVEGSDEAELADQVFDTQWRFIIGDAKASELKPYRKLKIGNRTVEADPDVLEAIADRGEADPAEYYRELFG